jgi:hypothetical protein
MIESAEQLAEKAAVYASRGGGLKAEDRLAMAYAQNDQDRAASDVA